MRLIIWQGPEVLWAMLQPAWTRAAQSSIRPTGHPNSRGAPLRIPDKVRDLDLGPLHTHPKSTWSEPSAMQGGRHHIARTGSLVWRLLWGDGQGRCLTMPNPLLLE